MKFWPKDGKTATATINFITCKLMKT